MDNNTTKMSDTLGDNVNLGDNVVFDNCLPPNDNSPSRNAIWSDRIEEKVRTIRDNCKSHKWMYNRTSAKNSFIYKILMYSNIILGPLTGIFSTIISSSYSYYTEVSSDSGPNTNPQCDEKCIQVLLVFVTVFSYIVGVVTAVLKFGKFEQKISLYKNIGSKYASLENNIEIQLALERKDRVTCGVYLEYINTSYNSIYNSAPLLTDAVRKEWAEFRKNNVGNNEKNEKNVTIIVEEPDKDVITNSDIFSQGQMKYELTRLNMN